MRHTRIIVTHYGGPDELRVVEEECSEPKHGEVRVRVLAAGVSLPDLMMREGVHPETPPLPFTPGWDLIGVVDRLGDGVSGIEPGQIVAYGLTSSLRGGRLASGRPGRRHRFRGIAIFGLYIAVGWLLPSRKRVVPYSIQWLKRLRPVWFRQDLIALFDRALQIKDPFRLQIRFDREIKVHIFDVEMDHEGIVVPKRTADVPSILPKAGQ